MSDRETFEQGDEAFDEETRLDPDFLEHVELDPSIDPATKVDEVELHEAGAELDDPEVIVTLQGGGDDPDGIEIVPHSAPSVDDVGWDLSEGEQGAEE